MVFLNKLTFERILIYIVVYLLLHILIAIVFKKIGKKLSNDLDNKDLKFKFKIFKFLNDWFAAIYVAFVLVNLL
jgi:hypothetical protein